MVLSASWNVLGQWPITFHCHHPKKFTRSTCIFWSHIGAPTPRRWTLYHHLMSRTISWLNHSQYLTGNGTLPVLLQSRRSWFSRPIALEETSWEDWVSLCTSYNLGDKVVLPERGVDSNPRPKGVHKLEDWVSLRTSYNLGDKVVLLEGGVDSHPRLKRVYNPPKLLEDYV